MKKLILHLHPKTIPLSLLAFNRSFGLGGMAVILFLVQLISGILLRFYYEPVPAEAYNSILHIHNEIFFGAFFRNIHHWLGTLAVLEFFGIGLTFFNSKPHKAEIEGNIIRVNTSRIIKRNRFERDQVVYG